MRYAILAYNQQSRNNEMPSAKDNQTTEAKSCSTVVCLIGFLTGIPSIFTLLNYSATFVGYGLLQLMGLNPGASDLAVTIAPVCANISCSNATLFNATHSYANPRLKHPICETINTTLASPAEFAKMIAIGTMITMICYSMVTACIAKYRAKNSDEVKQKVRDFTKVGVCLNPLAGSIAGGIFGFIKYCLSDRTTAELMISACTGILTWMILAVLMLRVGEQVLSMRCVQMHASPQLETPATNEIVTVVVSESSPARTPTTQSQHAASDNALATSPRFTSNRWVSPRHGSPPASPVRPGDQKDQIYRDKCGSSQKYRVKTPDDDQRKCVDRNHDLECHPHVP